MGRIPRLLPESKGRIDTTRTEKAGHAASGTVSWSTGVERRPNPRWQMPEGGVRIYGNIPRRNAAGIFLRSNLDGNEPAGGWMGLAHCLRWMVH